MATGKRAPHKLFHRAQIGPAQRFIRLHFSEPISLQQVAREAGSSSFHFVRLFLSYTGEIPFDFLRRVRLAAALAMLQEDGLGSGTEVALRVGYETPSAFNKAFRQMLLISPSEFRKLGQDQRAQAIYLLSRPRIRKELTLNLNTNFEIIARPLTHYVYLERRGPFSETAPALWGELQPILASQILDRQEISELLGLGIIDPTRHGDDSMVYEAGVALKNSPADSLGRLEYKKIPGGNYARFMLTGPYSQIGFAFQEIFKILNEKRIALRNEFCIENYRNDPGTTPEDQLLTELLIPVD